MDMKSVTINTDDYPELQGLSEEEVKNYIKENAWEMAPPSDCDWTDSLSEYLQQQEVVREKITAEECEIYYE